jgi:hypothetical protein
VPNRLTTSSGQALHDGDGVTWVGDVPAGDRVTVGFAVTVDTQLTDPTAIVDVATVAHAGNSIERRVTTLINALEIYLPPILKGY